jgi:undecaprenyl diphosphate synthase
MSALHVGIIMDGNGRWARARGLPRTAGHLSGARALRRTVVAAAERQIGTLTAFAFSSDNWKRPQGEVDALLELFGRYLSDERLPLSEAGVRLTVIGRRDRLWPGIVDAIERTEQATADGTRLHLRLAIDYSAREAIARAAMTSCAENAITKERIGSHVGSGRGVPAPVPDVDLLIRTGGEQRLSDFLLWESAYAELWFTDVLWPDFDGADLGHALDAFGRRERRFGGVVASSAL